MSSSIGHGTGESCPGVASKGIFPSDVVEAKTAYPISYAIFALARSHRGLAAQLLGETGLYPGQEIMLMQLWQHDHQSQNCLGRGLRLDHSTVAISVRRLEQAGLVTRCRSSSDGRVTIVSLTQAGRDLEDQVQIAWKQLEKLTSEILSDEEVATFASLLQRITAKVDQSLTCNEPLGKTGHDLC